MKGEAGPLKGVPMRTDPLFLLWTVNCSSPEEARRAQQWLPDMVAPDATIIEETRAFPDGRETVTEQPHRVGDYFSSVRVLPGNGPPASFRLLFHRRPDAGRFWKDLMVRLLQRARGTAETAPTLEYRGDQEPPL
jgi:hypothetical protein